MAFLEDPRLRQRWNQISHNAETVTENAAAGIWSFSHNYVNPCLSSISVCVDHYASFCIGDREERARRRREHDRANEDLEYVFDFYDDWYDEDDGGGGFLRGWSRDDWDRLVAGSGTQRGARRQGEVAEQPRRKRGMSYGTRNPRRKVSDEDPTVIPSTQPIGFLSRLPWKIGGTLRYKPSAADLQDNPFGRHVDETEPLLGLSDDHDGHDGHSYEYSASAPHRPPTSPQGRARSGTTGSGCTSDSWRSRGDLFPSDGEGEEDAVPLDDEFAVALARVDDRSSNKTRSSKGKRRADGNMSRTVSRTTVASGYSGYSAYSAGSRQGRRGSDGSHLATPEALSGGASTENLQMAQGERPRPRDEAGADESLDTIYHDEEPGETVESKSLPASIEEADDAEDVEDQQMLQTASDPSIKQPIVADSLDAVGEIPDPSSKNEAHDVEEDIDEHDHDLSSAHEQHQDAQDQKTDAHQESKGPSSDLQASPEEEVRIVVDGAFIPARLPHFS